MIRELYYDRVPEFHSDGNQRRDYIYVDDLIDLAMRVWDQPGFDAVNVSSNKNYSVRELYATACELMGKQIEAKYCPSSHYWAKHPDLHSTRSCPAALTASSRKFWTTRSTSIPCAITPTPKSAMAGNRRSTSAKACAA